jgi:hypothetical protein
MRHLRDFENSHDNSYCIFIAPSIHVDSAETFYIANTLGYKGAKQKIAPITIKQFIGLLEVLKCVRENNKQFKHDYLQDLIKKIVENSYITNNSDDWVDNISNLIKMWSSNLVN